MEAVSENACLVMPRAACHADQLEDVEEFSCKGKLKLLPDDSDDRALDRAISTGTLTTAAPCSPREGDLPLEFGEEDGRQCSSDASEGPAPSVAAAAVGCVPMWCKTERVTETECNVVPVRDGSLPRPILPGGEEVLKTWCWVHADGCGGLLVTPCAYGAVPKEDTAQQNETDDAFQPPWPADKAPTSLSISGLPSDFTADDLCETLDRQEYSGLYDFVAMAKVAGSTPLGVVNVTSHALALELSARLHGRTLPGCTETCAISWWSTQGRDELIKAHQESPSDDEPLLFEHGWPVPLPPATTA